MGPTASIRSIRTISKGLVKSPAMSYPSIKISPDELQKDCSKTRAEGNPKGSAGWDICACVELAKSPGVLRQQMPVLRFEIGHGGRVFTTMVAHPQHGVAVRALYNPPGCNTRIDYPWNRRRNLRRTNPNVARMLGSPRLHQEARCI